MDRSPCLRSHACVKLSPHLEGDAAHGQILPVLEHAQVLCHQSSAVNETLSRLGVVVPLRVFSSHVLQPSQPQVW